MSASSEKSSITLIIIDRYQSSLHPQVKLNNTLIPLNKFPKILGLTYDTHFTFSKHIENITNTAKRKLNIIRILSHNNFSNELATLIIAYKQFIRPTLNYASPAWYPTTSPSNIEKLQKTQNTALRIITGCTRTTPIQHVHKETKILPICVHLDMIGTQFYTNTLDISHPCRYTLQDHTRHRLKTPPSSPALYYSNIFRTIPPTANNTPLIKHIHTIITLNYLNTRQPNHLLNEQPPDIANTQNTLPRKPQITLSR